MNKSFYVVLPSNSCPLTQPSNNASLFNVDYGNSFKLDGNWEVALTEFSCIHSSVSLHAGSKISWIKPTDKNFVFEIDLIITDGMIAQNYYEDLDISIQYTKLVMRYPYPFTITLENADIANALMLNKYTVDYHTKKVTISSNNSTLIIGDWGLKGSHVCKVEVAYTKYSETEDQITFNEHENFQNATELKDYLNKNCTRVFRDVSVDNDDILSFIIHDGIKSVVLDDKLIKLLGFERIKFVTQDSNFTFKGVKKIKLKNIFNQFYIYSSVVDPIYVGSDRVPLLKNIWLENSNAYEYGDVVYVSIEHLMYLPVAMTDINKIEINIRNDSGKLIHFVQGSKSSITLHFRKNE